MLQVKVADTREAVAALRPAWETLRTAGTRGGNWRNDFVRVDSLLTAKSALTPQVCAVYDGPTLCAIAPFYLAEETLPIEVRGVALWSLLARTMFLMGDDVVRSVDTSAEALLTSLFDEVSKRTVLYDVISLQHVNPGDHFGRYVLERAPAHGFRVLQMSPLERMHRIELPDTHDKYLASLGAKTRQNLRRTTRRLFEDGRAHLLKVCSADQVPAFLTYLDSVAERSWRSSELAPHNTPAERLVYERLAANGWLRSYVLTYDNEPIAYELGVQYDDTFFGHECAYDARWADRGPGSILMFLVIEDLFSRDRPAVLDFGFGDAAYKRSLGSNAGHEAMRVCLVTRQRWYAAIRCQQVLKGLFPKSSA